MSINLYIIFRDPTHRSRAVGTLTGFVAAFLICALALMGGQNHVAIGSEWLVVSAVAGYVYVYGFVRALTKGTSGIGLNRLRFAGGTACYLAQVIGSVLLIAGYIGGLYVAAVRDGDLLRVHDLRCLVAPRRSARGSGASRSDTRRSSTRRYAESTMTKS